MVGCFHKACACGHRLFTSGNVMNIIIRVKNCYEYN